MTHFSTKPGFLVRFVKDPRFLTVRHAGKQTVENPRPPQFPRSCVETISKPLYPRNTLPDAVRCDKQKEKTFYYQPDHPYEILLGKHHRESILTSKFLAVCHLNAVPAADVFEIKKAFVKQNMGFLRYPTVVLRTALETTPYESMACFFNDNWMDCLVWSDTLDVIPKFLKVEKKFSDVILLVAAVNNVVMSKTQLTEYSKSPPIEVLHGQLSCLLSQHSRQIVQTLSHHQTDLVTSLATYVDDKTPKEKSD